MKKFCALLLLLSLVSLSGCAGIYWTPIMPSTGMLFSEIKAPLDGDVADTDLGSRVGKATSKSVLGWIATGDASIQAAARNGGITKIKHADYEFNNILGIYSEFTTVVYGD